MDAPHPRIRPAVPADVDRLFAIVRDSTLTWTRESFLHELGLAFSSILVVEEAGEIIGYAVTWDVAREAQLNSIAVPRSHRRRGIGGMLLSHIIATFRDRGYERILLEVHEDNEAARALYRAHGFVETAVRKNYYPDGDAVLMERDLHGEH